MVVLILPACLQYSHTHWYGCFWCEEDHAHRVGKVTMCPYISLWPVSLCLRHWLATALKAVTMLYHQWVPLSIMAIENMQHGHFRLSTSNVAEVPYNVMPSMSPIVYHDYRKHPAWLIWWIGLLLWCMLLFYCYWIIHILDILTPPLWCLETMWLNQQWDISY
jgi:hypothetical protein